MYSFLLLASFIHSYFMQRGCLSVNQMLQFCDINLTANFLPLAKLDYFKGLQIVVKYSVWSFLIGRCDFIFEMRF